MTAENDETYKTWTSGDFSMEAKERLWLRNKHYSRTGSIRPGPSNAYRVRKREVSMYVQSFTRITVKGPTLRARPSPPGFLEAGTGRRLA
jgi:hypothetical protein